MDQYLYKNSKSCFWSIEFSRRTLLYERVRVCSSKYTSHQVFGHHGFVPFKKDFIAVDESTKISNFTLFRMGGGSSELENLYLPTFERQFLFKGII
eukprot:snap_masked-scaffold_57-processed-gene-0.18-mRNA-1 protein AED:1.00 eAED:1.00 QI:0/-1/0/0/-1/1/1/0/95